MESIEITYNQIVSIYTLPGLLLMAAIAVLLGVQLWYWLGAYGCIPAYRNLRSKASKTPPPPVSVVLVVRDEPLYVNEILPSLLEQQHDRFEVVVVDMGSDAETTDALALLQHRYPHLRTTRLVQQELKFPITNKMALNVGIKAALYPNLILTTTEARPRSPKWLSLMARGFLGGEVVIGYCGIKPAPGLANRLMRAGRFNAAVRYLSGAVRGYPYRGSALNIGYTSQLYFEAKGFDHLDLESGDDDLFIQRIAAAGNTSVVMNPHASVQQEVWSGADGWFARQVKARMTWRHYPQRVKNYVEWDTGSRVLLYASCVTACLCMPFEIRIAAGAAMVLRMGVVEFQVWRIARRLGERGLGWAYIVYDIFSPLYTLAVWASATMRRRRAWR